MNWNTVNSVDAAKDSFGNGIASDGYEIDIKEASIFRSKKSHFAQITLKVSVNGGDKYLKLNTASNDDKGNFKEGFDSKRVMQLLFLLRVDPKTITEVPTEKDGVFKIPQIKGKVGCVIEYKPANSCKPSDNGEQYPEYKAIQFYSFSDGKTIAESIEKKEPKKVNEIIKILKEREYTPYKSNTTITQGYAQSAPSQFEVGDDLTDDDLPFK